MARLAWRSRPVNAKLLDRSASVSITRERFGRSVQGSGCGSSGLPYGRGSDRRTTLRQWHVSIASAAHSLESIAGSCYPMAPG